MGQFPKKLAWLISRGRGQVSPPSRYIDDRFSKLVGSLGRLGWLVMPAFSPWTFDKFVCGNVGAFLPRILTRPRRPCRPRHPYAVPRTSLQCVCTRRRNCIEQLSPSPEYAPGPVRFPPQIAATIKLTHYPNDTARNIEWPILSRFGQPTSGQAANPTRRPGLSPATPGGPCDRPTPCCGSRSASLHASPSRAASAH